MIQEPNKRRTELTNERIIELANKLMVAESRDGDYILPISFARAIEREVLAAAAPSPAATNVRAQALEEAQEAAKILDSFMDNVSTDGPYGAESTLTFIGQAKQCVDAAIRALAEAPAIAGRSQWIGVEDRLPEHGEEDAAFVWASWNGAAGFPASPRQGEARYVKSLGWQPNGCQGWDWNVTHWMPLPEAPAQQSAQRETGGE